MVLPALAIPGILKAIFSPVAALWRWLTADATRMAFAVVIALCAVLAWRLASVDGDRDKWRDKAKAYETASQIIEDADAIADAEARDVAAETKGTIDASNKRAADAAAQSDDPLAAGLRELRGQGSRKGD